MNVMEMIKQNYPSEIKLLINSTRESTPYDKEKRLKRPHGSIMFITNIIVYHSSDDWMTKFTNILVA